MPVGLGRLLAKGRLGNQNSSPRTILALDNTSSSGNSSQISLGVSISCATHFRDVGKEGHRKDIREGVPVQTVHGSQKGFRPNTTGDGPELTQQIHRTCSFQDGNSGSGPDDTMSRGLVGINRFKRCLLAHPYSSPLQKVPGLSSRRSDVSIYQASVRSVTSTEGVHQSDKSGGQPPGGKGRGVFDVPRRLASVLPFQGANSSQCKDHSTGFGRNGMAVKLPQIQIESHTNDNLARYQMVNFRCHPHPCARQRCKDTTSSQGMQFLQNTVTPPVRTDVGYHKLCCTRATTRKAEAQEVDTGSEQTLPKVPKGCSTTSSSHPFTPPKTVAPTGDFAEMCPLVKPGSVLAGVHRRIGRGLGIPIESGSPSMWGMDKGATLAFHKLQGTVRSEGVAAQNPDSAGHCGKVRHGQLHRSSLHKKAGNITLRVTPVSVRRYFPTRPASSHLPVSAVCPRHRERLGGCPLALPGNLSRVEPQTTSVRLTGDSIRSSPNRSLCIKENRSARGLPDILTQDSGWGSRRLRGRLEQVGFHLPFSSTSDHSPLESDRQAEVLPGQGFVHSPLLASSTLVQRTCRGLPASSPTRFSLPHRQPCLTSSDITASSRVDFLRKGLQRQFSGEAVETMIKALRPSSIRQYESCWRRFQSFMESNGKDLTASTILDFLSWLANVGNRAPATISAHYAALVDPLWFGADIRVDERVLRLLMKGIRANIIPGPRTSPKWSLHKVLASLSAVADDLSENTVLQRAIFLLALATGFRASQLAALTRHPNFTNFGSEGTSLTLAPSPKFLAKNERADYLLAPLQIPALIEKGQHLPLCPVQATDTYIQSTPGLSKEHLFYNSRSHNPLGPRSISKLLCRVIEIADPGNSPRAHSVRGVAASLAFLRSHSLTRVQELGGWASTESFLNRYLLHDQRTTNCVAMGTVP